MLTRFRILLTAAIAIGILAGGCASHSQNKKDATARWQKTSARVKLPLAQQQFDGGKYADAAKTVGECLRADPNLAQAHLLSGKIMLAQGHISGGITKLERSVELDEKLDDGWYWLGLASEGQKQTDKAYACYQNAVNLNDANIEYILAAARASVAIGKADEALQLLETKIAVLPSDVELKAKCAELLCLRQKYDEAVILYRQAVMLAPERVDIAESLGHCYIQAQQWSKAADTFDKLAASCNDQSRKTVYLQLLGTCQVNAGQYSSAIATYSKLSPKDRDNPQIWVRMAQAALGTGDAERAYAYSRRALELQPKYMDAIAIKGSAEYLKKDYTEAIKSFEQITADPAHEVFAWTMLSKCYGRIGDDEKAAVAAEKLRTLSNSFEASKLIAGSTDNNN